MTCRICAGKGGFHREWADWHPWQPATNRYGFAVYPVFYTHSEWVVCCHDGIDDWYERRIEREHANDASDFFDPCDWRNA